MCYMARINDHDRSIFKEAANTALANFTWGELADFEAMAFKIDAIIKTAQQRQQEKLNKIRSQPLYPISFSVHHNLTLNLTPEGQFQAVRVLKPGLPDEGEFEVLFEGSKEDCVRFMQKICHFPYENAPDEGRGG
jgi:hypothetical protein